MSEELTPRECVALHLMKAGSRTTADQVIALFRKLTGREPTPEEIAETKRVLDEEHEEGSAR